MNAPFKSKLIAPKHFQQTAAHARQEWHVTVPNDTRIEDLLKPETWVHVANQIKPYALIDVVTEDCHMDVQLRVTGVSEGLVSVRPTRFYENEKARAHILSVAAAESKTAPSELVAQAREMAPEGYKCGFNSNTGKFYVQLKATGNFVKQGIATMDEALALAKKHHAKATNTKVDA